MAFYNSVKYKLHIKKSEDIKQRREPELLQSSNTAFEQKMRFSSLRLAM